MSGNLSFMSPTEFQAGGPQAGAAAGIGQGVGQLAQVLARGPLIHAQAAHMATQDDLARAQTTGVQSDTALKQGKLSRAQEAQALLSDPNLVRDPTKMARLYAIGAADPDIASHLGGMVAGIMSNMAFNKSITQREADIHSGGSGAVAYQNTPTGVGEGLGNQRTIEGMRVAGAQKLKESEGQWVIGADGKPHLTTLGQATAGNMTPTTPENVRQGDTQVLARPRNAPPGTRPEAMTTRDAIARGYEVVSSAQVQAGDKPMSYNTPNGPQIGTEATAPGHAPIMTVPEAQGALYGNLLFPQQGQPSPLASALGGEGTTPFPLPSAGATPPAPQQPPAPTPGSPTAPATPVVPGAAATPAPAPAPLTDEEKLNTAGFAGQLATRMASTVAATKLTGKQAADFETYLNSAATRNYPLAPGLFPGEKREFGPMAKAEINRRAQEYFTSRNPNFRDNVGASVDQAIRDLQVKKTPGEKTTLLPPSGVLPGNFWEHVPGAGVDKHVVELQTDENAANTSTPSRPGNLAPPVPGQPPTATDAKTGKRYIFRNGQWTDLN
jgi:hypothetical protein